MRILTLMPALLALGLPMLGQPLHAEPVPCMKFTLTTMATRWKT